MGRREFCKFCMSASSLFPREYGVLRIAVKVPRYLSYLVLSDILSIRNLE